MTAQNTRERLIEAARGLFAERGFHNATVRDIAMRAHTNLASINYHFRSKDDLYREVMRTSFRQRSGEVAAEATETKDGPIERLRGFIRSMIPSSSADTSEEERKRLVAWEVLSPTGIIERADEAEVRSHLDLAEAAVRPFMPRETPATDVTVTALWLVGQCVIFQNFVGPARSGFFPAALGGESADQIVDTILTLALRGLGA
ncbi:MAG: CerR family C-terminal domain-containing protein [Parvibaculum sp.]|uniref:TetR/AcrR family transcriptional regulator n=1 Tax=Parvibaculum sp. TaxID=2024848 RepID=UPI0028436C32|nr:CerR family C-terminal domain-containing protein [Parvibaculum sp.]MDR3500778.1 CerR family C-terminal domain-containing protein [Parvibaculum sp.]